jgi:CBS domain containing-hemolysin-like protein
MGLLLVWAIIAVASVSLCSVLETTLFSVRVSALRERKAAGNVGAGRLLDIKANRIENAIGAILTVNTVLHTLGTTLAGAQAARMYGSFQVGVVSAGLMVCLLIFSEIIPKTLAARYAGALSGFTGHVLWYLVPAMRPFLFLTGMLIRLLARAPKEQITRREVALLVGNAPQEGALTLAEASWIGNLIYSREITLRDVMIPLSLAFLLDADASVDDLLASPQSDAFSRVPLYHGKRENIVGYIAHREVLKAHALRQACERRLHEFLHPIPRLAATLHVERGLEQLLAQHDSIGLVIGPRDVPLGIITVEDLMEALLGMEITDEADAIEQLRPEIAQSRKNRGEELRRRRADDFPPSE